MGRKLIKEPEAIIDQGSPSLYGSTINMEVACTLPLAFL